jgi:hypothetical protein
VSEHPYRSLPLHCFWRQSVAEPGPGDVDPVVRPKFRISRQDKIATAGSCFAQHIAMRLARAGFHYLVTEAAHPILDGLDLSQYGYGLFTARYGNIYTSRQLHQLLKRAYGQFQPEDDAWPRPDGRVIDPFRPQIQPNGFASMAELLADREYHFAAIRRAVETMDVFVFTLGLTETWIRRGDGAVYPLCPGVAGGEFDRERHAFVNLTVAEVAADLNAAINFLRVRNPSVRIILTVSPVPLIATAEDRSVLVSTAYSKAVLRIAAEEVSSRSNVAYFPSYEVITGNHARGKYFDSDLRNVTAEGVDHVMRLFLAHYADEATAAPAPPVAMPDTVRIAAEMADIMCDEVALARP